MLLDVWVISLLNVRMVPVVVPVPVLLFGVVWVVVVVPVLLFGVVPVPVLLVGVSVLLLVDLLSVALNAFVVLADQFVVMTHQISSLAN